MPKALYEARNDPACAELGRAALLKDFGPGCLYDPEPWMASESFALFERLYPGVLAFTGIGNPELGCGANHHTPEFDIDEKGMIMGAAMAVSYTLAFLNTDFKTDFVPTEEPVEELVKRNV